MVKQFKVLGLLLVMVVVGFSSCDKNEGFLQPEVNQTDAFSRGSEARQGGMRGFSHLHFGSDVAGWTKIKSGNNVTLYQKGSNIYIADVDLTVARIGLLFGNSQVSNGKTHKFQKSFVSEFAQSQSDCFLAVNFGFFHWSGKNYTWDASTYPFKQGSFVDIGASAVNSSDYTGNTMYTMVVRSGLGVRLDTYGADDRENFENTYANETKAYVVRNNVGNGSASNAQRTILAFTTKVNSYYQRMYIFVTSKPMKEDGSSYEESAKRYIKEFIEAQHLACVPITFCPLDGGGSTQLYVPGISASITSSRKVINALIVKD